jgi:WD40 repeat protein
MGKLRDGSLYAVADKVLVVGGEKELVTVYSLQTGKPLGNLPGDHRVSRLAISQDGRWLLTAGTNHQLHVWDVQKRRLLHELYAHTNPVKAIAISADGAWCASMTTDGRTWVFDRASATERAQTDNLFIFYKSSVEQLLFTPNGKTLIATGDGAYHGLFVWDWQKCRVMRGSYPREGRTILEEIDSPRSKWQFGVIGEPSIAADGTLLTFGPTEDGIHLWVIKPPVSPEPPPSKK